MSAYTYIADQHAYDLASALARGSYQRALLDGSEALSGATLTGKARHWSSAYARSRAGLLGRLRAHGVPVREARGAHGRRILVVGAGPVGLDTGARCA